MRLFIAVPLPADVAAAASAILPEHPGLRRVQPELMHATLAFLGTVPDERLPDAITAASATDGIHAFAVTLDTVGRFPASGAPRVAWIGMGEGKDNMTALAAAVRRGLESRDLPFDEKPFRPHITLARVRENVERSDVRAIAKAIADAHTEPLRFTVDAVSVIESKLSSKGPRYTSRAAVPLVRGVGRKR